MNIMHERRRIRLITMKRTDCLTPKERKQHNYAAFGRKEKLTTLQPQIRHERIGQRRVNVTIYNLSVLLTN